jgi:Xaa-Pro aminopeptidase
MGDLSRINMPALKHGMDAEGLDVLLAVSPENFFYVTDTLLLSQKIIPTRLCIAIVPRDEPPAAVVCYCEERQTQQDSWIADIRTYLEFQEAPMHALGELLKERGFGAARIGLEKHFLAASYVEELAATLPEATLVGADSVFEAARAIKTPAEIEILTEAARRTEKAILVSFQAAKPDDTEKKMADDLSSRVLNAGATSLWITLAVGANTAINHPYPGSKPLTKGEILRVDVGGIFQGYQSDVARTAAIGAANEEQKSIYRRLREAQQETIAAARPGVRACDLYVTCKRALEQRGLSITSQAVGHGLGIGLHEFPVLHANEKTEIKPGMVLNIEPAVKDSQGFLYHIEDLFVVTDGEPKILTTVMGTADLFIIR